MSFIDDYLTFCKAGESPEIFDKFSALGVLSTITGRKIYTDMGIFNVYPNLYIVYVAPPGHRKSASMRIAQGLLRRLDAPLAAEATSSQKLIEDMVDHWESYTAPDGRAMVHTPLCACINEMSNFFGTSLHQMADFLTDIYDEEEVYEYKIKHGNSTKIEKPYFVLLGCTTPNWIAMRLKDDVISGGFSRRTIFVYENERGPRIPRPNPTDKQKDALQRCYKRGLEIQKIIGQFEWTDAGMEYHDNWYINLQIPDDPILAGYYESKQIQVIKIAMLLSVSESNNLKLDKCHFEKALQFLAPVEEKLGRVFESVGRNELSAVSNQAVDILKNAGGWLREKRLRTALFRNASPREADDVLTHLRNSGQAQQIPVKNDNGLVINWYCLTSRKAAFEKTIKKE